MPATHAISITNDPELYSVTKNGVDHHAQVLQRRGKEVYVHYVNMDKRMDEWIPEGDCRKISEEDNMAESSRLGKRKRGRPSRGKQVRPGSPLSYQTNENAVPEVTMTEEEFDIQHHKQITARRNFDKVHFGEWQVKTWYFSPYPLTDTEIEEIPTTQGSTSQSTRIPGVQKTTYRSHGRTSDLLAGGLGRAHAGEKAMLWVCQQCFKYMADGNSYDLHVKYCNTKFPPGTKVYQRGAHTIWEVDGAKNKLYCQNLSLFGKLFIDVKTLFFDCDNFLFYILTDGDSQQDHILGFFSKEKLSYDDYNLACIMTLPPYQRKGYGMLMIEFSYELSRRAGKVGTPERPLSDLGLRSYLAYWVSTIVRFFRRVLSVLPPELPKLTSIGSFPDLVRTPSGDSEENGNADSRSASASLMRKRKKTKGWAGEEIDSGLDPDDRMVPLDDPMFTTQRLFETGPQEDGSASTHVYVRCTLTDIARATNLRIEDAAFALNECGLLMQQLNEGNENGVVVITRTLVEKVARERNVKNPCMSPAFVRL